MEFKEGIYEDLDYPTYASIPAWRSHDLTTIIKCPFTWKYQREINESPALLEGRVQHTVFLEHHKFDDEFALEPIVDRRTKAGKEEHAAWLTTIGDRTPCKQDLYDVCMERREVVKDYIPASDHRVELTVCFYIAGQPCKCKIDWYTGTEVWDLKTCRDASPRGFKSAVNNFRYYMQAAFYLTGCQNSGLRADRFMFLAQEKTHPYPYGVYGLSNQVIELGKSRNEQAMALAMRCEQAGEFKPYNTQSPIEFELDDIY